MCNIHERVNNMVGVTEVQSNMLYIQSENPALGKTRYANNQANNLCVKNADNVATRGRYTICK